MRMWKLSRILFCTPPLTEKKICVVNYEAPINLCECNSYLEISEERFWRMDRVLLQAFLTNNRLMCMMMTMNRISIIRIVNTQPTLSHSFACHNHNHKQRSEASGISGHAPIYQNSRPPKTNRQTPVSYEDSSE